MIDQMLPKTLSSLTFDTPLWRWATALDTNSSKAASWVQRPALIVRLMTLSAVGLFSIFASVTHAQIVTTTSLGHNNNAHYAQAAHMPYANPNAPKGGTLSMAATGSFNTVKGWATTGMPMVGTDYMYDTLMSGSLNEAVTMYPQLAYKVTYDTEDSRWIIYHIHPQARFWDGSPVTSYDVKATFEALLTKGPFYIRSYLSDIKEVQALDPQRVKFIFSSADNKEMPLIVGQFPVFAKKSIDSSFETIDFTPLLGSGPYKLGRVEPGRMVTYVRDPNYWGRDLMVNRGRFNFDRLKYVYYGSEEIAFEGFKSGQYRFRTENKPANWATAYSFPAVLDGHVIKEKISNHNPVQMQGIVMNLRRPIFADIRVRQAMTLAYDFEWMNSTLFHGQYERLQSYFHGSELAATGVPSAAEMQVLKPMLPQLSAIERQAVLSEWQLPKSDGKGFNRQALLKARQLLLEAGFYYQNMKLYQPDGQVAKIDILNTNEAMIRSLLPYIRNLQRLGFEANIVQVDSPQFFQRKRNYDYDMVVDEFLQGLSPGLEQASMWGSQAADEPGNKNTAGIKNPLIDAVIMDLVHARTREEIVLYSKVLDRLLRAGYYMVPTYGKTEATVAYWNQYRHAATLPTNAIGIDYWWADKQAEEEINRYLKK